jgi:hypothetical protein
MFYADPRINVNWPQLTQVVFQQCSRGKYWHAFYCYGLDPDTKLPDSRVHYFPWNEAEQYKKDLLRWSADVAYHFEGSLELQVYTLWWDRETLKWTSSKTQYPPRRLVWQ